MPSLKLGATTPTSIGGFAKAYFGAELVWSGAAGFTIAADGGTYAITGAAATLKHGWLVGASGGSYAITGSPVDVYLGTDLTIIAGGGSYAITGADATLRQARIVTAQAGSYAITGTDATMHKGYILGASGGSYAITGSSATLLHGWKVAAGGGSYAITGADVTLTKSAASPPTWVGHSGTLATGTTAVNVGSPSGAASGDLELMICETALQTVNTPSGWNVVSGSPFDADDGSGAGGSGSTRLSIFWRSWVTGNITTNDPGDHIAGERIAIRGVNISDPFDVIASDALTSASTSGSAPSVTTTFDNCLILNIVSTNEDASSSSRFSSWTNANLDSLTERFDGVSNQGNGGGFGIASGIKATAGSTGATTVTLAAAGTQARVTIAIKPA